MRPDKEPVMLKIRVLGALRIEASGGVDLTPEGAKKSGDNCAAGNVEGFDAPASVGAELALVNDWPRTGRRQSAAVAKSHSNGVGRLF